MHGRKPGLSAGVFLMLFCGSPLAPRGLAAQESCQSAQCHAALLQASSVHAAAESCDSCHESVATPHPQKGKSTFYEFVGPCALHLSRSNSKPCALRNWQSSKGPLGARAG